MGRLQEGKLDQAWADLLAVSSPGPADGAGAVLIDVLVAVTIEGQVCQAEQAMLQDARLTADQITAMRADLAKLPPPADMADKLDNAERFMYLDTTASLARGGWALCRSRHAYRGDGDSEFKSLMDASAAWESTGTSSSAWATSGTTGSSRPSATHLDRGREDAKQVDR